MSATAASARTAPARPGPSHATTMTWLADTWQMIKRNLIHIRRTPELLLDVTLSPIMFVLLFNFVFGGAISVAGTGGTKGEYINFLMAGIFVQTIAFAGVYTGVLLANDLKNGMIDRFRSLPMAQSSVLTGRTLTDVLRATLAIAIMWIVGLLVGFRPSGGALGGVAAGALVRTPEALQGIIFAAVFPLTFVSSAFVPTQSMPSWLAWFADRQPMTLVTNAVRSLTLQGSGGPTVIPAILWAIGILAVCFPLGIWLYGRRTTQ